MSKFGSAANKWYMVVKCGQCPCLYRPTVPGWNLGPGLPTHCKKKIGENWKFQ